MSTQTVNHPVANTALKSVDGGNSGRTQIINNSNANVQVFWIDRQGNEVVYGIAKANSVGFQNSASINHDWRIKDLSGNLLAEFNGSATTVTVNADDSSTITTPDAVVDPRTPDQIIHQTYGYGAIDVAKALGVSYDTNNGALTGDQHNNNDALKAIHDYGLWAQGHDGSGVVIGVVGTGIDPNNVEFSGRIVGGYDFGDNDSDPTPTNTHETGISSALAASADNKIGNSSDDVIGIAPKASLLNIKIDGAFGNNDHVVSQGIMYAVDHGAKVVTLSLGNPNEYKSQELYDAAKYAQDHNVVITVAAGNDFQNSIKMPAFAWVGLNNFIVVGNWNIHGTGLFTESNKLGPVDVPFVDAPSSGLQVQLNNQYKYYEDGGTSTATPYVAGLAALLVQEHPEWTANQIVNQITSTANLAEVSGQQAPVVVAQAPVVQQPAANSPVVQIPVVQHQVVAIPEKPSDVVKSVTEGDTINYFLLTLNQNVTNDTIIDYKTIDGTATAGLDYVAVNSRIIMPSGTNHIAIPVSILDDSISEQDETFSMQVTLDANTDHPIILTATHTIVDNDFLV